MLPLKKLQKKNHKDLDKGSRVAGLAATETYNINKQEYNMVFEPSKNYFKDRFF